MNRLEILNKLNNSGLNKDEIIVISGASLVLQGIIEETLDIDLSCTKEYYDSITWNRKIGGYGKEIKCYDVFDISNNLYFPDNVEIVDGYKVLDVAKCLEIKKQLNRNKDKEVIKLLEKYIKEKTENE